MNWHETPSTFPLMMVFIGFPAFECNYKHNTVLGPSRSIFACYDCTLLKSFLLADSAKETCSLQLCDALVPARAFVDADVFRPKPVHTTHPPRKNTVPDISPQKLSRMAQSGNWTLIPLGL